MENSLNKTIKLEEVIEWCKNFISTEEHDKEEIEAWLNNIEVKSYLSLMDKASAVNKVLFLRDVPVFGDEVLNIVEFEKLKFWHILLLYTNIDIGNNTDILSAENYDVIYSVIGDYIYIKCYNDYNRTIKMIDDIINYTNIQKMAEIVESLSGLDTERMNESLEDAIGILDGITDSYQEMYSITNQEKN